MVPRKPAAGSRQQLKDPPEPAVTKQAILVLGMHRCGTSAVTRLLSLLGADLPSRLMPAEPGANELGFWESQEIVDIHDELLAAAGSSWDDVADFPGSWFETDQAEAFRARLLEVLNRDFSSSELFVLKDPRLCRLVPLWRRILEDFGAAPSFVLPLRNPLEVAESLRALHGLAPARSYLLWLGHVLASEGETRGCRRSLITYEAVLRDWRAVAAKIAEDLGISWPRRSAAEIDRFLSDRYRHYSIADEQLEARDDVPTWVKSVWAAMSGAADGKADPTPVLNRVRRGMRAANRAFGPIVVEDRQLLAAERREQERLGVELTARDTTIAELKPQLAEKQAEIERLAGEKAILDGWTTRLQELASGQQEIMERLAAWSPASVEASRTAPGLARLQAEIERFGAEAASRDEERLRLQQQQAAKRDEEVARLEGAARRRDEEVSRLQAEARQRDEKVARLEAEVRRRDELVARLEAEASQHDETVARLEAAAGRYDEQVLHLQSEAARRNEEIGRLQQTVAASVGELAGLTRVVEEQRDARRKLKHSVVKRERRIEHLEKALAGEQEEVHRLLSQLAEARADAQAMAEQLQDLQRGLEQREQEERLLLMDLISEADTAER